MILIEASPCAYSTRSRLDAVTTTRIRAGKEPNAILHEGTPLLLRDRSARPNPIRLRPLDQAGQVHGKGKALSILDHKLGRAAYYMLARGQAFDLEKFMATGS